MRILKQDKETKQVLWVCFLFFIFLSVNAWAQRLPSDASKKDYYKIIGIDPSASIDDIKKAYRLKARDLHPDAGGDEEGFKLLGEAYSVLKNTSLRQDYDELRDRSSLKNSFYSSTHGQTSSSKSASNDVSEEDLRREYQRAQERRQSAKAWYVSSYKKLKNEYVIAVKTLNALNAQAELFERFIVSTEEAELMIDLLKAQILYNEVLNDNLVEKILKVCDSPVMRVLGVKFAILGNVNEVRLPQKNKKTPLRNHLDYFLKFEHELRDLESQAKQRNNFFSRNGVMLVYEMQSYWKNLSFKFILSLNYEYIKARRSMQKNPYARSALNNYAMAIKSGHRYFNSFFMPNHKSDADQQASLDLNLAMLRVIGQIDSVEQYQYFSLIFNHIKNFVSDPKWPEYSKSDDLLYSYEVRTFSTLRAVDAMISALKLTPYVDARVDLDAVQGILTNGLKSQKSLNILASHIPGAPNSMFKKAKLATSKGCSALMRVLNKPIMTKHFD